MSCVRSAFIKETIPFTVCGAVADERVELIGDQHNNNNIGTFYYTCTNVFDWHALTQTCNGNESMNSLNAQTVTDSVAEMQLRNFWMLS